MRLLKRWILLVITLCVAASVYLVFIEYFNQHRPFYLQFEVSKNTAGELQLFAAGEKLDWSEDRSVKVEYPDVSHWQKVRIKVPEGGAFLRLDEEGQFGTIIVRNMSLDSAKTVPISFVGQRLQLHEMKMYYQDAEELQLQAFGRDPYFYIDASLYFAAAGQGARLQDQLWSAAGAMGFGVLFYCIARYSRDSLRFIREVAAGRKLVFNLAKNDFKTKYASSYLGVLWGFIHPLLTIATYWFVFQVGLRSGNVSDMPFILWFIAGIIPWFFFSEALSGSTNAFYEYSYLVKKVVFQIQLLPAVKIVSALFVQLFFVVFIFLVYGFYGYPPTWFNLQILYYIAAMLVLVTALGMMTSAIVLFFKDLTQIITVVLQIGFWFTPIGWSVTMLSGFWSVLFKLNPMFYIVQGYRDSLIDHIYFYERPIETLYFWLFCLTALTLGIKVFKRLKPHFPDVL
ncbi:ABC transporter permease [Paenibacillus sp. JX-17]|uniref:Transport permease protein n=1 Tax=Paenibacillus lacisoli TaxID=3064525 RepID=A0ABT9CHV1_9BACL|nr:ABC transporter permease [Paenibacillus sp. JX-17]MDO7908849.1 ABC transporter permease [Paenibacillus sp. JX-17]